MASEFVPTRVVEFAETDMAGIVHFSNFFLWMESCELAFYRSLGLPLVNFFPGQFSGWPRVKVACEYHAPLRFEDTFQVQLLVEKVGVRSLTHAFRFRRIVEGVVQPVVLARGSITAVCAASQPGGGLVAHPIPADVRERLAPATPEQLAR